MKNTSKDGEFQVAYVLLAQVNGRTVFEGTYPDTFEVQTEGLIQSEDAVDHALGRTLTDLEPEEVEYVRRKGIFNEQ